jgi:hypothetical protein
MSKEFIACSATHFDDGKEHVHQPKNIETGVVICGLRHHNIYRTKQLIPEDVLALHPHVTGFLTNKDRFVDRVEGLRIAEAAGQIVHKHCPKHELMSEDIF